MQIYHFTVASATNDPGPTVHEFRDLAEAQGEALKLAQTAMCDASETFWSKPEWMLVATDDAGVTVFQLQVLGAEGPAADNLSRRGFGEGTFDQDKKSNEGDTGVDGC